MPVIAAKAGQSLVDIAIQVAGSAEAAWDLAFSNGLSLTEPLRPGQLLTTPPVVNGTVVAYYRVEAIEPATTGDAAAAPANSGIGSWILGQDFIVQ